MSIINNARKSGQKDFKKLLNLNILNLTNQTYSIGKFELPYIKFPNGLSIDYLALYTDVGEYNKTQNTAVCFYQYDNKFDGIKGLFNAIYYNDEFLLKKYKERFKNVKYAVSPDYSMCGDIPSIENYYRIFKARIVAMWLTIELGILTIPNITYANENYFDCMLDGMEETNVVAFSVKGSIKNSIQKKLLLKAIVKTVDTLKNLTSIIVYSVCKDDETINNLFEYAISKNIKIVIPNNVLRSRNKLMGASKNGKI